MLNDRYRFAIIMQNGYRNYIWGVILKRKIFGTLKSEFGNEKVFNRVILAGVYVAYRIGC
jgi:hypothetical protein